MARGTGSTVLFVGGGGPGHGTVVAGVAGPRGAGEAVAGAGDGGCVWAARGTACPVLFVGRRRTRTSDGGGVRGGTQGGRERQQRGPAALWRRLRERERRE